MTCAFASRFLRPLVEDTAVIDGPDIVFLQNAIRRPNQQIRRHPFQRASRPPEEIKDHPLILPEDPQIIDIQTTLAALIVLCKDILELLGSEPPLVIVGHAIAAVFGFVQAVNVDAEVRIREDEVGDGAVGKTEVDDQSGEEGEHRGPAKIAAAGISVARPDDRVFIAVPVGDMLLNDLIPGQSS